MIICKVQTITKKWLENVLNSISNGEPVIDYWTNNRLPDKKRNIKILEVHYLDNLVLVGEIINVFKDTPYNTYNMFKTNLLRIGLDKNDTFNDFESLLKIPFGLVPDKIGNIVFEVKFISTTILKNIIDNNKEKNIKINIKEISSKTEGRKKLNRGFVYEEI